MYNGHLSIEEIEQLSQQKGAAENHSHAENCRQCQTLLEKHRTVSAKLDQLASVRIGAKNAMNCPDERVWFDVAAGTLASDESLRHVQHAAECESCAQRLRAATRMFQEELSPEEEKEIAALPSAGAREQRKLAQKMAGAVGSDVSPAREISAKRRRSLWWPLSFSLAGAAAVAAAVFFVWPRNSPADVEKLLAQAYTQDRTIEMRIPGAKHAEIRQLRAAGAGSILGVSGSAREAQDKISAALKKDPESADWLILQAQLYLLDWRYQAALSMLNRVETDTNSSSFLLTRALALNEQGQIEHDPQLQGEAVDVLGRVLQKEPDNTTALFNQAVACEELYMYECASKDWHQFLNVDKDSGWAAEARQHLNRIEEKKTPTK